jgi:catalase
LPIGQSVCALARARRGATIVGVTNEPERKPTTTTGSGSPAASDEHSLTVGPRGPTALHEHYLVQKMQHAIAAGDAAEWRLETQIMPFTEAADYPPITVGRMMLDRNPANPFAEVDQSAPNSHDGPHADPTKELPTWWVAAAEIGHYAYEKHAADDDFVQPRAHYRDVMRQADRDPLVSNVVAHASDGVSGDVQARVDHCWTNVDAELGARVAAGLGREMRSAA